jgi:hypothetical protein
MIGRSKSSYINKQTAPALGAYHVFFMDENQAPLTAQTSKDLFSDSNSEILNTTQAASICGVSYHKFLREFGEIPYTFVYPGGPRIYYRSEVRAFIEGKNK